MGYANATQLLEHYDANLLADLAADGGSQGTVEDPNVIITRALNRATADIRTALKVGGAYTDDELDALDTADDAALLGLCCDLAVHHLVVRRGGGIPDAIRERLRDARTLLADLRKGSAVFDVAANIDAGAPEIEILTADDHQRLDRRSNMPYFPGSNTTKV